MSKHNTGNCTTTSGTCPNCGYCPHCGRRDAAPVRPYPYVYPAPWVYPRYVPGPIWINQPNTVIGGGDTTSRTPSISFNSQVNC